MFATPKAFAPITRPHEGDRQEAPFSGNLALILICPLLVAALYLSQQISQRKESTPPHQSLASFPAYIGEWQGEFAPLDQEIIDGLQFSDYFMANYRHPEFSSELNFYLAYYENQRKGASPHSPKVCIPGGGWEITEFSRTKLDGIPVNRAVIEMGLKKQLVYYWFIERGQLVANEYVKKWLLLSDSLQFNRSDGALVRIVIPVDHLGGMDTAQSQALDFVRKAQPIVMRYLPPYPQEGSL